MTKKKKNWIWFFLEFWLVENISEKKIFLADLENTTKLNRIFSASLFTDLSIPMNKKSKNWIWFFLEFWLVENISEKKIFLADLENTTKVNRIFSASQFTDLSIPMTKK